LEFFLFLKIYWKKKFNQIYKKKVLERLAQRQATQWTRHRVVVSRERHIQDYKCGYSGQFVEHAQVK